jgi:hypothetical protein
MRRTDAATRASRAPRAEPGPAGTTHDRPAGLIGLISLLIIVAYYMLRCAAGTPVGSTFLWHSWSATRANAPQRLRSPLLLQLLIALVR